MKASIEIIWRPSINEINQYLEEQKVPRIDIISIQQFNDGFNLFYVHRY
jgi:hypothetical protein